MRFYAVRHALFMLAAGVALCLWTGAPVRASVEVVEVVLPAPASDAEQADESTADIDETDKKEGEPRIESIAEIPPERLVEPPSMGEEAALVCAITVEPLVISRPTEYPAPLITPAEWERVLAGLFGEMRAEEEAPAEPEPAAVPPAEPERPVPERPPREPKKPVKPEKPPAVEEAEEEVRLTTEEAVSLALQVKSGGLSDDYARVVVSQGRVSGNTELNEYDIAGKMNLYYKDISGTAKSGHIDQDAETVTLADSVLLTEPNYDLTCEYLTIRFKDKSFVAKTFVRFKKKTRGKEPTDTSLAKRERVINIFKNEPTEVYGNVLTYNWDTEEMSAIGEVKVVQGKVTATMDRLDYNPDRKTYRMQGNVFVTLLETEWIFEHELVEEEDIELAEALAEKETTLEADLLLTGEDSDLMTMRGGKNTPARITQEDKELIADEIVFDDRTKTMAAKGNVVFYQENGDWLREGKLIEGEPDEAGQRILENELTSASANLTFNYDDRILHQWGDVEIVCGDESLVADDLVYNDETKMLYLTGTVGYFRGEDEYLYADEVAIDTDKNHFEFTGIIESFIYTTEEEREKARAGKAEVEEEEGEEAEGEGETQPPESGIIAGS